MTNLTVKDPRPEHLQRINKLLADNPGSRIVPKERGRIDVIDQEGKLLEIVRFRHEMDPPIVMPSARRRR